MINIHQSLDFSARKFADINIHQPYSVADRDTHIVTYFFSISFFGDINWQK